MSKSDTHLNFRIFNQVKGLPYCDSFNIEENWLISSISPLATKCAIRLSIYVMFKKSTIFKSKIENTGIISARSNFHNMMTWAKDKIAKRENLPRFGLQEITNDEDFSP